ncbi:MAG: hypothetical protein DWH78_07150 [Planctomycetota bacterium]|nr:MAG: hypothetical protein DWH78_07150 [Planctomycetota bacterium]
MRHLAGSFCSLGLGVSAFCHAVIADSKPEASAPDAVVFRTSAGTGPQHFALALRSAGTPESIKRHVILVDTSASQIGKFRDNSLNTLAAVLDKLPAGHSVMVAAVDSDFASLTDGFVPTGSEELKSAVSRLSARTPMGATDLSAALRNTFSQNPAVPMSVLYIGDGISAADQLSAESLDALVDDMISRSVSFHAFLLGPQVDTQLTGILANQTGGTFENSQAISVEASAERLAMQLTVAPEIIRNLEIDGQSLVLAAHDSVALRSDRHTVVFGKGAPSNQVHVSGENSNGKSLAWDVPANATKEAGEELHVLFERAEKSGGLNSAVVGIDGLMQSSVEFKTAVDQSIAVARRL